MVVTFRSLQDQVLRFGDEAGTTGTKRDLVKDILNQTHQQRCAQHAWPWLLSDVYSFNTVVGQREYMLHQEFGKAHSFYNRTRKVPLHEVPSRQLQTELPQYLETQNVADHFALWGKRAVKAQPSTASTLSIVSNNAADTGAAYQVVVKGEDAAGNVLAEVFTPSGTTPVVGGTAFAKILTVTKAQDWNGTLTVTSNAGAVTNITLLPWEMGKSYQRLYVLEEPTSSERIDYQFYEQPLLLINDYDVPQLPFPHVNVLIWDSLLLLATYDSSVDPNDIAIWKDMQQKTETALYQTLTEGQSLGARSSRVRDLNCN